jgi:cobyric acid synthase
LLVADGHLHVLSTTPASGKTVITTGLIRALRDQGRRVLPFKPVSETTFVDGVLGLSESVSHQCFAAGTDPLPEISPVRVVPVGREADVWLFDELVGRVPRLGRDMPVIAALPSPDRAAIVRALTRCREALRERCDLLISEGSGAATAQLELGLDDYANVAVAEAAEQVLLVARASSGTALTSTERVIAGLRERSVSVTGFLLNDVAGYVDEHVRAARRLAERSAVPFIGVMPWTDFFEGRPKYSPPSAGCAEDHRHLADLVSGLLVGDEETRA